MRARFSSQAGRFQVGNGPRHAQHAVHAARRQLEPRARLRQQQPAATIQPAQVFDLVAAQVGVELAGARAAAARARRARAAPRRRWSTRHPPARARLTTLRWATRAPRRADRCDRAAARRCARDSARFPAARNGSARKFRRGSRRDRDSWRRSSWKRAGYSTCSAAREMATTPVSSGSRRLSSTRRLNSGSSSRNSTPRCARLTSPGPCVRTAADDRARRRGVMRRAERPASVVERR